MFYKFLFLSLFCFNAYASNVNAVYSIDIFGLHIGEYSLQLHYNNTEMNVDGCLKINVFSDKNCIETHNRFFLNDNTNRFQPIDFRLYFHGNPQREIRALYDKKALKTYYIDGLFLDVSEFVSKYNALDLITAVFMYKDSIDSGDIENFDVDFYTIENDTIFSYKVLIKSFDRKYLSYIGRSIKVANVECMRCSIGQLSSSQFLQPICDNVDVLWNIEHNIPLKITVNKNKSTFQIISLSIL